MLIRLDQIKTPGAKTPPGKMADVRKGNDPSAAKQEARTAPAVKDLCKQFIEE